MEQDRISVCGMRVATRGGERRAGRPGLHLVAAAADPGLASGDRTDLPPPVRPGRSVPMREPAIAGWQVFRHQVVDELYCAVPVGAGLPRFLIRGPWIRVQSGPDGGPPVLGFQPVAARHGAGLNGFYLFQRVPCRSAGALTP